MIEEKLIWKKYPQEELHLFLESEGIKKNKNATINRNDFLKNFDSFYQKSVDILKKYPDCGYSYIELTKQPLTGNERKIIEAKFSFLNEMMLELIQGNGGKENSIEYEKKFNEANKFLKIPKNVTKFLKEENYEDLLEIYAYNNLTLNEEFLEEFFSEEDKRPFFTKEYLLNSKNENVDVFNFLYHVAEEEVKKDIYVLLKYFDLNEENMTPKKFNKHILSKGPSDKVFEDFFYARPEAYTKVNFENYGLGYQKMFIESNTFKKFMKHIDFYTTVDEKIKWLNTFDLNNEEKLYHLKQDEGSKPFFKQIEKMKTDVLKEKLIDLVKKSEYFDFSQKREEIKYITTNDFSIDMLSYTLQNIGKNSKKSLMEFYKILPEKMQNNPEVIKIFCQANPEKALNYLLSDYHQKDIYDKDTKFFLTDFKTDNKFVLSSIIAENLNILERIEPDEIKTQPELTKKIALKTSFDKMNEFEKKVISENNKDAFKNISEIRNIKGKQIMKTKDNNIRV